MNVLGIDSASPAPGVAILTGPPEGPQHAVSESLASGAAELLVSRVLSVADRAGVPVGSLDRVAVVSGPGSFTGLRAGLAFARGLARSLDAALVLVPTFEAASAAVTDPADVDFVLEAGRGEVHRARRSGGLLSEAPSPLPRVEAEAQATAAGVPVLDLGSPPLELATSAARLAALASATEPGGEEPRYGRVSAAEEKLARSGGKR